MLVQPYVVAFMIMSSQDVLFVSFDQIFVHVVIIAFVQLERVGLFNCTYCQDGCVWCIPQHTSNTFVRASAYVCSIASSCCSIVSVRCLGRVETIPVLALLLNMPGPDVSNSR